MTVWEENKNKNKYEFTTKERVAECFWQEPLDYTVTKY